MKTILEYFEKLKFDKIESYRFNKADGIVCSQRLGKIEVFNPSGNSLPNSILDDVGAINKSAELVCSTSDSTILAKFDEIITQQTNCAVNTDMPIFKNALLFYRSDSIVGGINISFYQGILQTIENQRLTIPKDSFENLRSFFYIELKHETYEFVRYFGNVVDKWREFHYPNSFYFNPQFEVFETTISTPILCLNHNSARLEIEPLDSKISQDQLRKINYVAYYPYTLKKKMFEMVYEYYQEMKDDFGLPEINAKELDSILPFFVRLQSVMISKDKDSGILLGFRNWDEEHGMYIRINDVDDSMEFEY